MPAYERDPKELAEHDDMVNRVAEQLRREGYRVHKNLGQGKISLTIDGQPYFPDVFSFIGTRIIKIYEIETASTITERDTVEQWTFYSLGMARFYLVVPNECVATAKKITDRLGINVTAIYPFSQFYRGP